MNPGQIESMLRNHEDWLMRQVLGYAKRQGYTRYTSTLEEAWRVSIRGLSDAVALALDGDDPTTDFTPDESFQDDPISDFAVIEAARHRERGVELKMFLGLFKYYRQAYLDLVDFADLGADQSAVLAFKITRIFDRLEISYCSAWAKTGGDERIAELQDANRRLTNEKNRFLTVTESLADPVILFDGGSAVTYANQAAGPMLGLESRSGSFYYREHEEAICVPAWLLDLVGRAARDGGELSSEQVIADADSERVFDVRLQPMLDVSDKFEGTVVIFHDVSDLRRAERDLFDKATELEKLSHTDPLTGLFNRRGLLAVATGHLELARRKGMPLAVLFGDVDNLKKINDEHGHAVGDAALRALASAMGRCFRAADVIARVGGDEFVVLLPSPGDDLDEIVRGRLNSMIQQELGGFAESIELNLSVGWARFAPDRHKSVDDLLSEADEAMYEARRQRRRES